MLEIFKHVILKKKNTVFFQVNIVVDALVYLNLSRINKSFEKTSIKFLVVVNDDFWTIYSFSEIFDEYFTVLKKKKKTSRWLMLRILRNEHQKTLKVQYKKFLWD